VAGTKGRETQEFTSEQLKAELIEIKERLGSLETIASLANREIVEKYVTGVLKNDAKKKALMRACESSRSRTELKESLGFESPQALDYHLTPLRETDLIHESRNNSGVQIFEWSKLFKHLPKATRDRLIGKSL
jgi:DNA-binding transcriptional ArsR family regulator